MADGQRQTRAVDTNRRHRLHNLFWPVELGLDRTKERNGQEDRYEKMDLTFHKRLRLGFLEIAKREPERCIVLDASTKSDNHNCDKSSPFLAHT